MIAGTETQNIINGNDDTDENEGKNMQKLKFQCLKDDSSYNTELQQGAVYFISSPLIFA